MGSGSGREVIDGKECVDKRNLNGSENLNTGFSGDIRIKTILL